MVPSYGTHIDSVGKKINQREVTQKLRKGEQSFLYVTNCLNLIHITIKFHQDIPYGYLLMVPKRLVKNFIKGK